MPATIIYKTGFPSTSTPIETSATIASDGFVTGAATFVVPSGSTAYPVNSNINQNLFSTLNGVVLQGLFVETRSLEKRGGLNFLRIGIVGVINPPVFEEKREISPRSLNKSQSFAAPNQEFVTKTFSFDYLAETVSVSAVFARGTTTDVPVRNPTVFDRWNISGEGLILNYNPERGDAAPPDSINQRIIAYPRILSSESREERAGIVRITKSAQFIYE